MTYPIKGDSVRQWHVSPKLMCSQHLLGEHVEHHMFIGAMRLNKNLDGYISNGLLDPPTLVSRHDELATEMTKRGMKHKSPLSELGWVTLGYGMGHVDSEASLVELRRRCEKCRQRHKETNGE